MWKFFEQNLPFNIINDPDYCEYQSKARKRWRKAHPDYMQNYRKNHPEYREKERTNEKYGKALV